MSTEHLELLARIDAVGRRRAYRLPPAMQAEVARALVEPDHASDSGATWAHGPTVPAPELPAPELPDRYEAVALLGRGGMGVVLRVRDRALDREVALKYARPDQAARGRSRFVAEAITTASLVHPGIVPIYDCGEFSDGTPYYTMPLVRGRTVAALIAEVHRASPLYGWAAGPTGTTLQALIQVLRDAAAAAACAHARGIVHRDLKPENLMVGEFGGTLVLDWGLARRVDRLAPDTTLGSAEYGDGLAGTPGYMAPEQGLGFADRVVPATDVHALGATLYEILGGDVPYPGSRGFEQIARTVSPDPPDALPDRRPLPGELVHLAMRSLAKVPEERPRDAAEFAAALTAWLDGVRRREAAEGDLEWADTIAATAADCRAHGEERRARVLEVERQQLVRSALGRDPDFRAAHDALAAIFRAEHLAAEAARDFARANEIMVRLRAHDRGAHTAYIEGRGRITLVTDPPAEVRAYRYEVRDRRVVPVPFGELGQTPFTDREIGAGSWLLELRAPERVPVRYPVLIPRAGSWSGGAPGERVPRAVVLPRPADLGPDDRYVPAGPFLCGGDGLAQKGGPLRWLWLDGFVMRRFPVTNREYLAFIDDLAARGAYDAAADVAPRLVGEPPHLSRDRDRLARAMPNAPVTDIDGDGCVAFAEWEAGRTSSSWRLPWEAEWEKAARGVDGRWFPWGDAYDPAWLRGADSAPVVAGTDAVDGHPVDRSPYGIRGTSGNVHDRCLDAFHLDGPAAPGSAPLAEGSTLAVGRGGSFRSGRRVARCATRFQVQWGWRSPMIGFRLVRSFPG